VGQTAKIQTKKPESLLRVRLGRLEKLASAETAPTAVCKAN
jgi:hypothetical protein